MTIWLERWLPWVLAAVSAIAYSVLSLKRFAEFTVTSWDLAIFQQAVKGYSQFEAPIVPVKGPGFNILGDHFSPIYAVLAPIYRVFPHAQTLLIAQAVLVGVSVGIIAALAIRHLGLVGAWIGVLYALSFGIQEGVAADFHEVAFALPFLALAGSAYVDGRFDKVMAWSLPLVLVKEDMGITVAAVGLALWLVGERTRGTFLAVLGVVATVVTVVIIIPSFNAGDAYEYTGTLGGDAGVVSTFFTGLDTKATTLLITFGITGLFALLSPWALVAVPTLLWRFVGDVEFYWGTQWHYSMVLMPIVFVALIDTIAQRERTKWPALALATAASAWTFLGSPLTTLVGEEDAFVANRAKDAETAMTYLPKGTYVESDLGLLSHLVSDHTVYWRGTVADAIPDYIVFDRSYSDDDIVGYAWEAHGREYRVIHDSGQFVVAERAR